MPTVETNGVETSYERRGTGPPVVFVHGAVLDHRQWAPQAEALADEYTVVTYDVRGHGRTGGSPRRRYSMDLFADDLDALVRALDLERPVVCGHSTGGCIAQVYAAVHADDLAGLVLADTFTPPVLDGLEWLQRSLVLRATVPPVRLLGIDRVERAMVWLQERIAGTPAGGDYDAVTGLRASGPRMTTDEFAKVIRAVDGFRDRDLDLGAIHVPTLVLYGEDDVPFVRRHAERLWAELPDATVRVVPGAGHAANLDDPAFVTRELRTFLARVHGDDPAPPG